ncbi:MAG: S9 family peptidase [Blastocatellia bacterium]|nr:S9 family peptidase [Blastocatellia bacterium]
MNETFSIFRKRAACLALALAVCMLASAERIDANGEASSAGRIPIAQGGRSLTLKDYYRIESVGSPAISPDGRQLAFTRSYIIEADNRRHSEIWIAPTDGSSAPSRITHPAFNSSNPRWSPDGKLLSFTSRREVPGERGGSSIWFLRMDRPGGEAFQIEGVAGTPIFSPDNRWIAFTRRTPPASRPAKQYASDFEKRIEERFEGRIFDWMNYRFDGRGYLPDPRDPSVTPPAELYIVPREERSLSYGGTPRQITHLGVDVQSAAWRPDSRALALEANEHQRDEYIYERADIWIVTLEGETRRLTDDGYNHSSPEWSPDGRSLVFRRQKGLSLVIESKQNHGAEVDLYRLSAEGGKMENLTAGWDYLPGAPTWSADGKHIYFNAGVGGTSHLFRVPAAGGVVEQITRGDRSLGGFSMSQASDHMAYTATDPLHPGEVFSSRADGSDEKKLTAFNDALLKEVRLSRTESILYPSKDGTEIEGWVMLPRNYDASRGPYPLILNIHGGPHGAYGNNFSFQFQVLAASGYAVLYTNPRGSTGYGEKFLWATWGGWGKLDYEDVLAGVDHVMKRYPIDGKRLGVTGYSYGGFLTNWVITQTKQFKAAIVGAGISNWISDYGTADIPRTKESEFFGTPWEARSNELLRKWSPINYAGNVATPTLFIHGESDFRVPIEQAEQMYTALKKRRVHARFIRYPDTSHGGWTPWNTVHRYYQELKWWEEHLSSPGNAGR